jgi:hypothetical protein
VVLPDHIYRILIQPLTNPLEVNECSQKTKDRFEENSENEKQQGNIPAASLSIPPKIRAKNHHTMSKNEDSFNLLSLSPSTIVVPKQHANRDKHKMNEPKKGGQEGTGTEREKSKGSFAKTNPIEN